MSKPLHPGPWPEASESWFWTPVPEPFVFSYILFSKLAILGSRRPGGLLELPGPVWLLGFWGGVWALDFPWAWAPGVGPETTCWVGLGPSWALGPSWVGRVGGLVHWLLVGLGFGSLG